MAPLIFIIEIIGHLARILSLSFRLFGNMMGHEIVLAILFGLAGAFFAPLPIMALGVFVAFVQGFVFFLLSADILFRGHGTCPLMGSVYREARRFVAAEETRIGESSLVQLVWGNWKKP
jgi:hypothetical protein